MIGLVLGIAIVGLLGGLIGGLVLMLATKIVFKQSVEFSDAFKVAAIATIVSALIRFGINAAMGPDNQLLSGGLGLIVGYLVMTFVVDQQLGIGLSKAAIVSAVVYGIYIVLWLLLVFVILAAVLGTAAAGGGSAAPLILPGSLLSGLLLPG